MNDRIIKGSALPDQVGARQEVHGQPAGPVETKASNAVQDEVLQNLVHELEGNRMSPGTSSEMPRSAWTGP